MIWIAILAILITSASITVIYDRIYRKQIYEELKINCKILAEDLADGKDGLSARLGEIDQLRVTLFSKDGSVLFDNKKKDSNPENQKNRAEVAEAFSSGTGQAGRWSDSLNKRMYYYAQRLSDGSVLRCGRESSSIFELYHSALTPIVMILALLVIISILLSHLLTKKLLRPIELAATDIDRYSQEPVYRELSPFMNKIRSQHERILKSANLRQEFTANVSHELKTPLTVILGYSELIENKMVTEEQTAEFAGEIRENATRLLALINDIIRLSELDDSEVQLNREDIDLGMHAKECVERLEISAKERGVHLQYEGASAFVYADASMLEELLENLISNAIRYNRPDGYVRVLTSSEGLTSELIVEDNGIGIPEEDCERIFERFYRVDRSRSKETGGTGLGLSLVKHIAELHHATISVESKIDEGTVITVRFPASAPELHENAPEV